MKTAGQERRCWLSLGPPSDEIPLILIPTVIVLPPVLKQLWLNCIILCLFIFKKKKRKEKHWHLLDPWITCIPNVIAMKHLVYWIIQTPHLTRVERRPKASIHANKSTIFSRGLSSGAGQPAPDLNPSAHLWGEQCTADAVATWQIWSIFAPLDDDCFLPCFVLYPILFLKKKNSFFSLFRLDETPPILQKVWKAMRGQPTFTRDYSESNQSVLMTALEGFWIQTHVHIMGCKYIIFFHLTKTF